MELTFPIARVREIYNHTKAAVAHKTLYDQPDTAVAGIWMVGDTGVYLMSNGDPMQPTDKAGDKGAFVAYADECNPETMEFDDWWAAKRESFGGDDGVELFTIDQVGMPEGHQLATFSVVFKNDELEWRWTTEPIS